MWHYTRWMGACVLVYAGLVQAGQVAPQKSSPRVMLESGMLEGEHFGTQADAAEFVGIPFAAPPVGELRWKTPESPQPWKGIRSATQFGPACPQLPARWFSPVPWNEDCLYLNVWTQHFSPNAKLPVIVYFHGGSNTQGYSQMTPLGPSLSRYGVIVVSANYRLGPFGFLAHPALTRESEHHASGNYGLLDQLQALKWVQRNIAQFGGDPSRVTVMGQSSGAVDACLLMASPLARGLFQRAILQSGECQGTLNEDIRATLPYNSIADSDDIVGERLAKDLGVPDGPEALRRLRKISADEVLKAWSADPKVHFDAIVDGWVIPEQPAKIFAERKELRIPVLVGSNADEATVFGHNKVKTLEDYRNYLRADTGNFWQREFELYPAASDADVPAEYLRLQSDSFAYGAYSLAESVAQAGQSAYLYYFTYAETGKRARLGAYHGEELNFLAQSFPDDWQHSPADERLGETMRACWTQFAKTGDPNGAGFVNWPKYDEVTQSYFELGRKLGVRSVDQPIRRLGDVMRMVILDAESHRVASSLK